MRGRLDYLDGLRGIAAASVLLQHCLWTIYDAGGGSVGAPFAVVDFGRFGVLLFFLISGFVIPPTAASQSFATRRAFQLLPALWVSVLAYSLIGIVDGSLLTVPMISANMAMLALPLGQPMLEGAYWTLTYELGFYLFCMLLVRAGQLHNVRLIGSLALLSVSIGAVYSELVAFPAYLLTGMIWREAYEGNLLAKLWGKAAMLGLIGFGLAQFPAAGGSYLSPISMTAASIAPPLVFLALLHRKPRPGPALLYLGTVSYSLYLFQSASLWGLKPVAGALGWWIIPVTFVTTLGVASLVYRYVERPCMALGKSLTERNPAPRMQAD